MEKEQTEFGETDMEGFLLQKLRTILSEDHALHGREGKVTKTEHNKEKVSFTFYSKHKIPLNLMS